MKIIAIANQKGGCGKTTTAINLSACLGDKGQRVLLLDMDPQGHASLGLGQQTSELPGLYEVINNEATMSDVILHEVSRGLDLIPSTISLAAAERVLANHPERSHLLSILLEPFVSDYDYIIIDCPPSLGLLSINALRAAEQVISPVDMGLFALDGIERLQETINLLCKQYNKELPIIILPTMIDLRTRLAKKFLQHIDEVYRTEQISNVLIHHTVRLKEAACEGRAIIDYMPQSIPAMDYDRLADEVIVGVLGLAIADKINSLEKIDAPKTEPANLRWDPVTQRVVLNYQKQAGDIKIAGDYNGWVPDKNVETKITDGSLQKILNIEPGNYEYRIVVDGKWQHDPTNPEKVDNKISGANSLLHA